MISVAVCPICDIAGCYHIRGASVAIASASAAMRLPEVPTDAQMHDACTSFRHDYGLLGDDERKAVQHQCREWWRCVSRASGPKPTPDVWPWEAIDKRFNYAARDLDFGFVLFTSRPVIEGSRFWVAKGDNYLAGCLNVTIGACDWRDSLVVRPGYVEAGANSAGTAQDAGRGTANASEGQQ